MARIGSRNEARFRERPHLRKSQRAAIREMNHSQRRTGMKLSSLRSILERVHDRKMSPDVAYNTIKNVLMNKDYTKKRTTVMEFFLSLFKK